MTKTMNQEAEKEFKKIEAKWQKFWREHPEMYRAKDPSTSLRSAQGDKEKKYVLVEFPYPSGSGLHVGHAFTFTGGDVYARYQRMKGGNVCFPMGWDAFGLPTENYAIKTKQKPQEVTKKNTAKFRSQMDQLAYSFDWSRTVDTTDPNYYRWTQWIFVQLFKKGLAYKEEMPINWCPACKIGLANEEVISGHCERCGTEVERRTIAQWVVKITAYADRLADDLKKTNFIEKVKMAQINWIGKSEGAKVKFQISNFKFQIKELEVFTTRPDTLYGATFMVVAPEHNLVNQIVNDQFPISNVQLKQEIIKYVKSARSKSDLERTELNKEKTGVFSGLYAINPITNNEIPIWISDFVLASYGTGAIMAVPAHDERDHAFAKKFKLPIIPVIKPKDNEWDFDKEAYTEVNDGEMMNSLRWNGMVPSEAIKKAISYLKENDLGEATSSYHLRDWIFSRQHYWGEPIPMICCQKDGWVPVPEDQLPVVLPEVEHYEPTDDGKSPLSKIDNFVQTTCPVCGGKASRETDTMPNWAGSDWYYLGYILSKEMKDSSAAPQNDNTLSKNDIFSQNKELIKHWLPVDVYIGGDEHNTLHLLYSRFIYKFLYDIGVLPNDEPYTTRISHGVILGPDNQRMSKSHGNVIVPEVVADIYGVDVIRCYLMFMGPFDGTMAWNEKTLMGVKRFLDRFNNFIENAMAVGNSSAVGNKNTEVLIQGTIKAISEDIGSFKYNTAIAELMKLLNQITNDKCQMSNENLKTVIKLIAPFAPYTAEELWSRLPGEKEFSVHISSWPVFDEKILVAESVSVAIAIGGKVRDQIVVEQGLINDEAAVVKKAVAAEKVSKWLEGKEIVKSIYVPGKMLNLVVR